MGALLKVITVSKRLRTGMIVFFSLLTLRRFVFEFSNCTFFVAFLKVNYEGESELTTVNTCFVSNYSLMPLLQVF